METHGTSKWSKKEDKEPNHKAKSKESTKSNKEIEKGDLAPKGTFDSQPSRKCCTITSQCQN